MSHFDVIFQPCRKFSLSPSSESISAPRCHSVQFNYGFSDVAPIITTYMHRHSRHRYIFACKQAFWWWLVCASILLLPVDRAREINLTNLKKSCNLCLTKASQSQVPHIQVGYLAELRTFFCHELQFFAPIYLSSIHDTIQALYTTSARS